MRDFDDYGLKMARYQGELFSLSRENAECSSPVFMRRFMYSDVAHRMDQDGFLFGALDQRTAIQEIEIEFGTSDYGKIKYSREELYWIGYIYRYWCYTRTLASKSVYKMIKPNELRKLYYPYHSLDPAQAIERIMEAKKMKEEDDTEKGVEILRKLMKKTGYRDL